MIKTLGPLEDASDLVSIAPVLHHWADVISKADKQVCSHSREGGEIRQWQGKLRGRWGRSGGWGERGLVLSGGAKRLSMQAFLAPRYGKPAVGKLLRPVC